LDKTGCGSCKEQNGEYEGEWKDNKKEGWGKKVYEDTSYYIGHWENDKKNGYGMYQWQKEVIVLEIYVNTVA
jgi:hypothetical protein